MTSSAVSSSPRIAARSWWVDMVQGSTYVVAATGVAFFLAGGGFQTFANVDDVYAAGRALGIVAALFMLFQVLLISRAPFIECGMGHDRAVALHTRTGKVAIILMAAHAGIISAMSAYYANISVIAQSTRFFTSQRYLAMAQIALGVFVVIFVTSLLMARSRWRCENWNAVHWLTYARFARYDVTAATVTTVGDGSSAIAAVTTGTRVMVEGPFGLFSEVSRTRRGVVLIADGLGITPVRAMLEELDPAHGPVDVIVRTHATAEVPILDEIEELAAAKGVPVHVVVGARGDGWSSTESPATLKSLVPDIAERDVYMCGPGPWAAAVENEVIAAFDPIEAGTSDIESIAGALDEATV